MSAKDLLSYLIPPADAGEKQLLVWRVLMGLTLSGCVMAIICLYIITAKADDINEVKVAVYPSTIQQLHREMCLTDSEYLRRELAKTVEDYQQKYIASSDNGSRFPLEDCKDIRARTVNTS